MHSCEYVALGCLDVCSNLSFSERELFQENEHGEIVTLRSNRSPTSLADSLAALLRCSWLRATRIEPRQRCSPEIWRIYLLSEGSRLNDASRKRFRKALQLVLSKLLIARELWTDGSLSGKTQDKFDPWMSSQGESLYYMFNTIPSPNPITTTTDSGMSRYSQAAMRRIMDENEMHDLGFVTIMYPYQKRAAAFMLQRESLVERLLDPRLEERHDLEGNIYYWNSKEFTATKEPPYYDSIRGGILAESMGLGKTVMCLALILATKDHLPSIPAEYSTELPAEGALKSLQDLSAQRVLRNAIPWRSLLDTIERSNGDFMGSMIDAIEKHDHCYHVPPRTVRSQRTSTAVHPSKRIQLCKGTLIVVPRNLIHQWQHEINRHLRGGILKVLVMDSNKIPLPTAENLASYDIILFSRPRFEFENQNLDALYQSPLKSAHFLRLIIDEGHNFSAGNTNAAVVAEQIIKAERRWIVSGTPAKDLMGIEVDLQEDGQVSREVALEGRKRFNGRQEFHSGAIKSIGALVSGFFKARPWSSPTVDHPSDGANWDDYVYRHEDSKARTFHALTPCFQRIVHALLVKTQPGDVERDIILPALTHSRVRLEPSLVDRMTTNLFVLVFTTNAITSERQDIDYLFHPKSAAHLHRLISNLRLSAFTWTGFDEKSVQQSLDTVKRFLQKVDDPENDNKCSDTDRAILAHVSDTANLILTSTLWRALSRTNEIALFVEQWPEANSTEAWALDDCEEPMAVGLTSILKAQKLMNNNLALAIEDWNESFDEAGRSAKLESIAEANKGSARASDMDLPKFGVPASSIATGTKHVSRRSRMKTSHAIKYSEEAALPDVSLPSVTNAAQPRHKRKLSTGDISIELDATSPIGRTSVLGSSSSKFSYLLDRILELYANEKILIFYNGGDIAYYLSQALDLFHVKHLIYANTLSGEQRSKYIVLFDTDNAHRVLLMDIKQAAHGLNLSSASRVFFVNPVCRPDLEAQAIKRAHRIGQTRPVHVETLLLRGTVEEAIHDRSMKMTKEEHLLAKSFIEDDMGITKIIQDAQTLPIQDYEVRGRDQIAGLMRPQQLFGRPGRGYHDESRLEQELFGERQEQEVVLKKQRHRSTNLSIKGDSDQLKIRVDNEEKTVAEKPSYESIFGNVRATRNK